MGGASGERELLQQIRLELGRLPGILGFRNSIGATQLASGQWAHQGLPKGSSDIIGIADGVYPGRWLALEVKTETGRVSPEQEQFLALVRRYHGYAAVVRSVDEAIQAALAAQLGEK